MALCKDLCEKCGTHHHGKICWISDPCTGFFVYLILSVVTGVVWAAGSFVDCSFFVQDANSQCVAVADTVTTHWYLFLVGVVVFPFMSWLNFMRTF